MNEANEYLKHVVTRRQLLRAGSAGVGSLALQSMLAPEALAKQIQSSGLHFAPKAKRIIFLFMNGDFFWPILISVWSYKGWEKISKINT